ncbi:MAG: divergent polysaccharide deacetylase family protein [Pseudomonadota bacterium]
MRGFFTGAIAGLAVSAVGLVTASYLGGPVAPLTKFEESAAIDAEGADSAVLPDAESTPAESDDTPVAESDDTPVAESDETPAADGGETTVAEGDDTPVAEGDDTPVAESDATPAPDGSDEALDGAYEDADVAAGDVDDAPLPPSEEPPTAEEEAPAPSSEETAEVAAPTPDASGDTAGDTVSDAGLDEAEPDNATDEVAPETELADDAQPEETLPDTEAPDEDVADAAPEGAEAADVDTLTQGEAVVDPPGTGETVDADAAPVPVPAPVPDPVPDPVPAPDEIDTAAAEATDEGGDTDLAAAPDPEIDIASGEPIETPQEIPGAGEPPSAEESIAVVPDLALPDQPTEETTPEIDAEAPNIASVSPDDDGPVLPGPEPDLDATPVEPDADLDAAPETEERPALEAFAALYDAPIDGLPLMAVLLVDTGLDAETLEALEALEFPMTIAVNPTEPGAREAADAYRAAGHEVTVITPLSEEAGSAEVERAMTGYLAQLPETIAVLDVPDAHLQQNRPRAAQVSEILKRTGHGLITYPRGLNSGVQVAQLAGVPSAIVFREIDDGTRQISVMMRLLDVGAFRASQEGSVVVVGALRPAVIAAVKEWTKSTRAATVSLVPTSAVLLSMQ